MNLLKDMIYNKNILGGVEGDLLIQPFSSSINSSYIPNYLIAYRQSFLICATLSFPTNLSDYEQFREINNLTGLVYTIEKHPFGSVLRDLHNNLSAFDDCFSNYSMFLENVNSWMAELTSVLTEPGEGFIFEEVASPFLAEMRWYRSNLLYPYEDNEIAKLQLSARLNEEKIANIVFSAYKILKSITSEFSYVIRVSTSLFRKQFKDVYTTALHHLITFQKHFTDRQDMFRTRANQMKIWQIPAVTLDVPNILSFKMFENQTWRVWPAYMDIQYFVDNQITNVFKLIDRFAFYVIEEKLLSIDRTLQDHVSAIEKSLQELRNDLNILKVKSAVDSEFIL